MIVIELLARYTVLRIWREIFKLAVPRYSEDTDVDNLYGGVENFSGDVFVKKKL